MTHGALFNGIAGFPLAAAWAGIETTWTCEIDEFCNKVSKKHFPNAKQYTDIRLLHKPEPVEIISGGFPCQPFSVAGKQLAQDDSRHLWPEMLRVIREVKPAYVIGENVTGIISLALDEVLASLEAEGYTTETFIVPACGVGAPHRRDRVWIIAYAHSNSKSDGTINVNSRNRELGPATYSDSHDDQAGLDLGRNPSQTGGSRIGSNREIREADQWECFRPELGDNGNQWNTAHPINQGLQRHQQPVLSGERRGQGGGTAAEPHQAQGWDKWPTQSPVCDGDDGVSSGLVRNRVAQLKAGGNAIVPQVAYQFFEAIKEIEAAKQGRIAA